MDEESRSYKFGRKVGHGLKKVQTFPYKAEIASILVGWGLILGEIYLTQKMTGFFNRQVDPTFLEVLATRLYDIPAEIGNLLQYLRM